MHNSSKIQSPCQEAAMPRISSTEARWVIAYQDRQTGAKGYSDPLGYAVARALADHWNTVNPSVAYWLETAEDVARFAAPGYFVTDAAGQRVPLLSALAALGLVTDGGK